MDSARVVKSQHVKYAWQWKRRNNDGRSRIGTREGSLSSSCKKRGREGYERRTEFSVRQRQWGWEP